MTSEVEKRGPGRPPRQVVKATMKQEYGSAPCCGNCEYLRGNECRYHAPTPWQADPGAGIGTTRWPIVTKDAWCGMFKQAGAF